MAVPDQCVEAMLRNSPGSGHPDVIGPIWGSLGGHLDPSGGHLGVIWDPAGLNWTIHEVIWGRLGSIWGTSGVTRGSMEGPSEGHVLQTLCFKLFLRDTKKPQDEPINCDEGPRRAQGGYNEVQGGPKEGLGRVPRRAMCSRPFVLSFF